ncbi:Crp/Fnr family transcriptional regulator [Christensenellaceae bacterium OttesenSCG-928-K19]|nr:Crp/Fnr family transcriptional regulator [Christensenellaceae bacterium OttesenSCG-928-K19]
MNQYFDIILKSPLFGGIRRGELVGMLDCLRASVRDYPKDAAIFLAGGPATRVGFLLRGNAQVVREDVFGNRTILTSLAQGDMFGEVFACAEVETLPVSVMAAGKCVVLLLDYKKLLTTCSSSCAFHNRMIENMMRILAQKNLRLNEKIEAVSARGTRAKLLTYLAAQARRAGSPAFTIPFNRQELADYLAVDRSAMSAELGRMQGEGLLRYDKSRFELANNMGVDDEDYLE